MRRVTRIGLLQTVTFERLPTLIAERLVLPDTWVPDTWQRRSCCDDPVGVAAKQAISGFEAKLIVRRELEAGADEVLTRQRFE